MAEGFYFANWRIWPDLDRHGYYHLWREGEEIVFSGNEFTRIVELLCRMDNAGFIHDAQVHSTEE